MYPKKGSVGKVISSNVTLERLPKIPQKQTAATAQGTARRSKKKKGK